jgi:hypothetical protein
MRKNKYIIFAAIGFELVGIILITIYGGEWLVKNGAPEYIKAVLIVAGFVLWFISLMMKLKKVEKND